MSKNCMRCVASDRTGPDLLCDACRTTPRASRINWTCGPTCGCGKTFEAVADGKIVACPHCGREQMVPLIVP